MRDRDVDGLLALQCASGAFPSTVEGPEGHVADETCFVTAQVALILASLARQGARACETQPVALRRALARALNFVETCAVPEVPGAFSFYPPDGTARLAIRLPASPNKSADAAFARILKAFLIFFVFFVGRGGISLQLLGCLFFLPCLTLVLQM